MSPFRGGTSLRRANARAVSAAPTELLILLFAVSPGFHIGLRPHFTLGFAGVSSLQGSLSYCLCVPRVSYRASPSFHPGLCRSVVSSTLKKCLNVDTHAQEKQALYELIGEKVIPLQKV